MVCGETFLSPLDDSSPRSVCGQALLVIVHFCPYNLLVVGRLTNKNSSNTYPGLTVSCTIF